MHNIDQRQLGASDLVVPALGVGLASWGEALWGYGRSYSREDITHAYRACLDAGLNFFDTAGMYARGESERLLGACRRADGRPIVIASKFAPLPMRSCAQDLLKALDNSLERLGVERIDLYQIHMPTSPRTVDAFMDTLAKVVQAGKVRAVGVSNYNASLMRRAHARLARHGIPLASNQVQYSLLYRSPETNGVLDTCRELNVALIAYSPLTYGILSGKYRKGGRPMALIQRVFAELGERIDRFGDTKGTVPVLRRLLSRPRTAWPEKLEPLFVVLEEVARAHEKTIAQIALNWLLHQDRCVIPIPGAKNAHQATQNAGAINWRLTEEEYTRISQVEAASRS